MQLIIVLILFVAAGALWFDDNSKRTQLDAAQQQVQQLGDQVQQLNQQLSQANSTIASLSHSPAPATANWFQQRSQEKPMLDPLGEQYSK